MLNEIEMKVLKRYAKRYREVLEDVKKEREKYGTETVFMRACLHENVGGIYAVLEMAEERLGTTVEINWNMMVEDNIIMVIIAGHDRQIL